MNSIFVPKPPKPPASSSSPPESSPTPPAGPDDAPSAPGGDGLMAQLTANPLFTGGIGLILLTGAAQIARKSVRAAATHLRHQMLITLEIPSTDKSYDWLLHWMSQHHRTAAPTSHPPLLSLPGLLSRFRPQPRNLSVETKYTPHASGGFTTNFSLLPGTGTHTLNYANTLLRVNRERDSKRIDLQRGTPWELLTLTTLFSSRHVFSQLLAEARSLAEKLEEGKTIIYTSWSTEWKPFGQPRRKRPLSSVVLEPGVKERILNDLTTFLKSAKWYHDRGIPYRRGYLFHGPPGTGKSSLITALAGELDYAICVLNLSERGLTDDRLQHLLSNLPERSIALLEDVDAAFGRRRVQTDEDGYRGSNVTFSGLLNALDGVASSEERVVVMTTNWVDRLDEALVRPGRVDMSVEIGWAGREVVGEMWERFYGRGGMEEGGEEGREEEVARREGLKKVFVERLGEMGAFSGEWGVSAASLQGMFVFFKGDPDSAVREVAALVPESVRRVLEGKGEGEKATGEVEEVDSEKKKEV